MAKKKDSLIEDAEKIKAELNELKKKKQVLDPSAKKAEAKPAKKAEAKPVKKIHLE